MTTTSRPTDPAAARRSLRREIPSAAAVLADERDFTAMRRYASFPFDDHAGYLRQMEILLRTLAGQGVLTTVGLFDPAAYAQYCADRSLDPDRPDSRSRYTAEVARTGATVTYDGEPLTQLLPLLVAEADRQATWDRATALLTRAGRCETCGADLAHAAFTRAGQAVQGLLDALGDGTHHLVCSIAAGDPPLLAVLHAGRGPGARPRLDEHQALIFCTVLAAGLALRTPGGIVSRTTPDPGETAHDPATAASRGAPPPRDTVRGWSLRDAWPHALSAGEVFTAYCTDADSGEPVPPEPGVSYAPGLPVTPPPDHPCHP
ncbi:hypothetical protein HEK616_23730 [Streptomyces nigrescens]|uniref:Uncharacterized protein n=2 Tax=Streptomyces TaxID=1883 RepID=A0ABN6QVD1_STRNI|nr:hypothetical protein [Streptomyces nigrescens]MEE4425018.1 hypothetical protein [Streptomyces sp. DSM 41528]BDM68886.1 hypothetical protein HEK616_23730 [Streptomyces nigrescens]